MQVGFHMLGKPSPMSTRLVGKAQNYAFYTPEPENATLRKARKKPLCFPFLALIHVVPDDRWVRVKNQS
jgi:hypothetical protein